MDSITQATLGAAVGELVLGKRLGNRAIVWGAVIGTLPDLDIIFYPLLDSAGQLWWHRGPSHSLLVMVVASILLARPLARMWQRDKVPAALAGWFVFLNWSTHVLIDCFTTYGTLVFWPFTAQRVAFNNLSIIDPLFTLPILAGVIGCLFLRKKPQLAKRRRLNRWGLTLACLYTALSLGGKTLASRSFDADLERRGVDYERRMESPTLFNILLWRSAVDRGSELWIGYRSIFEPSSSPVRWTIYPKGIDATMRVRDTREMQTVDWFSDGWWIARPHAKGVWVADLRFGEMRIWGARKGMVDHRYPFTWDILPDEKNDRLRQKMGKRGEPGPMLQRLAKRMIGIRDPWEGNPRLEGVTGSLPEFLATQP